MITTALLALTAAITVPAEPLPAHLELSAAHGDLRWYTDLAEARRVAAAEGKHVVVDFTGTGWCSWCKRLEDEVLSKPAFHAEVEEDFVFVVLEFDAQGQARDDRPKPEEADRLAKALGVTGFPTLALMTAEGQAYASLGYEPGGPTAYADQLLDHHAKAKRLQSLVPRIAGAVASAKSRDAAMAAADEAAGLLRDAGPHVLARPLVPIVRSILVAEDLAPERETLAVSALSAAEVVDDDLIDRAFRLDPTNARGLPEAALAGALNALEDPDRVEKLIDRAEALLRAGPVFHPQRAAQLYGQCAYWSRHWLKDPDRSRIHARFALRLEPEDPGLRTMLESLSGD